MGAESRLGELKLTLPPAPKPAGLYKPVLVVGQLVYVSGHGPLQPDGTLLVGKVGAEIDLAGGQAAARQCGLAILASLRAHLGSLDRVGRLIKLLGLVNCTPDFAQQPAVMNGCSELFRDMWGDDAGVGVRSAMGANALPSNMTVEIETIFELI
jgi:enamine deaminase RidA (YjgF/YER057c/UK114 family)